MTTISESGPGLPTARAEDVGMCSKRLERLTCAMQRYIDDELLSGTVTLVARRGKIVHFEALGHRYREANAPMAKDTIFNIMSMTKPIISTALMMLHEEGYFILDDPISKYLPEIADKQVAVGYGVLKDPGRALEPLTPGSFTWGGAWGTLPWADPVEEMIGISMVQIAPFFHTNVRPVATICATQAIIDSNSNRPFSAMGYEKLP